MPDSSLPQLHDIEVREFDAGKHGAIFTYRCSCGAHGHKNSRWHDAAIEGVWHAMGRLKGEGFNLNG